MKFKIAFSIIGFLIIFIYLNKESSFSSIFKSYDELFFEKYLPIEMKNEKYLGEIADSANHMTPYIRFSENCLPLIDQWENKFHNGDVVSKMKGDSSLLIKNKDGIIKLKFDKTNFEGSALPCKCSKILSD